MESTATYTEAELVHGLHNRDEKVFSYLYDLYSPSLFGVIIKVLNDNDAANDVLQEVFLKIWRNAESYDTDKGRLFTWMLNIARNSAIDVLRSKSFKQEQKTFYNTDDLHAIRETFTTQPTNDHLGFSTVLEKLTKEQRILIDLAYYKGCTQEEIAKLLDIPLGTVKTRMRNAINHLRNIINSSNL